MDTVELSTCGKFDIVFEVKWPESIVGSGHQPVFCPFCGEKECMDMTEKEGQVDKDISNEVDEINDEDLEAADEWWDKLAMLITLNEELVKVCKQLIMHRNQNNLHPIDYQRIELILDKIKKL